MSAPLHDNPVYARDCGLWGRSRERSLRLGWLIAAAATFVAMALRRTVLGIEDDWLVPDLPAFDLPLLSEAAVIEMFRHLVASPKALLALFVAMKCLEEVWRSRECGSLDELYLSPLEGRAIVAGKIGALVVPVAQMIGLFALVQAIDVLYLFLLADLRSGVAIAEILGAVVGALEAVSAAVLLGAIAWVAGLREQGLWRAFSVAVLWLTTLLVFGALVQWLVPAALWEAVDAIRLAGGLDLAAWQRQFGPLFAGTVIVAAQAYAATTVLRAGGDRFHERFRDLSAA